MCTAKRGPKLGSFSANCALKMARFGGTQLVLLVALGCLATCGHAQEVTYRNLTQTPFLDAFVGTVTLVSGPQAQSLILITNGLIASGFFPKFSKFWVIPSAFGSTYEISSNRIHECQKITKKNGESIMVFVIFAIFENYCIFCN